MKLEAIHDVFLAMNWNYDLEHRRATLYFNLTNNFPSFTFQGFLLEQC